MRQWCTASAQLNFMMHSVSCHAGEGMVAVHPLSVYVCGRSPYLFKIKPSSGDMDGIVASTTSSSCVVQLYTIWFSMIFELTVLQTKRRTIWSQKKPNNERYGAKERGNYYFFLRCSTTDQTSSKYCYHPHPYWCIMGRRGSCFQNLYGATQLN